MEELLNQADDIEILEEDEERRRQVRGKQWQEKQRNKLVAKEIQVSLAFVTHPGGCRADAVQWWLWWRGTGEHS